MQESPAPREAKSAVEEYTSRLEGLNAFQEIDQRRERLLGYAKLAIAAGGLVAAALLIHRLALIAVLPAVVVVFVVLAIWQEKILGSIRDRARVIEFYERGLARLQDRWAGIGETGESFLDPSHPYARDLDLFGNASLFQFLCIARTRRGEETLAKWLLTSSAADVASARQAAIRDVEARLVFREQLYAAGESARSGVHPDTLAAWGESAPVLTSRLTRGITTILALLWIGSIVTWAITGEALPAVLVTLLNFAYAHRLNVRLDRAVAGIERASGDLRLLGELLALVEREHFEAQYLVALQSGLRQHGIAPSSAIRRLARIVELIESRHSLFARPLDLVTYWSAQLVFVAERWQREFGPAIRGWIAAVGELEAISSFSTFAFEHPGYAFAEFVEKGPLFEAEGIAHPLLPAETAVENDVCLDSSRQLMILSGPNMAGKSTFMRSIGINAVLAQCGAPARARRLRISPLRVAASICILDSLTGGISRFYAEIRRVKLIADLADGQIPVLFLLDELLSGTNSHDRFIGTQFVLQTLVDRRAIGLVSTHDLALTKIAEQMPARAFNAHFEDTLQDGKLVFDYKLRPGIVQTSNALKLMRAIGLGVTEQ